MAPSSNAGRRPDSLHQLPNEILLDIIKLSPDFSSLWSIINTSPRLAALFGSHALEITETVLVRTVPIPTQTLLRAVLHLRFSTFNVSLTHAISLPTTLAFSSPVSVDEAKVFNFVRSAHKIHVLAHKCIDFYIQRCMTMNFARLANSTFSYHSTDPPLQPRLKRPEGIPYQPDNTGPPLWVEEQRVILNLWRLEYHAELKNTLSSGLMEWPAEDLKALEDSRPPDFFNLKSWHREEVLTVSEYIETLSGQKNDHPHPSHLETPTIVDRFDFTCAGKPSGGQGIWGSSSLTTPPVGWKFVKLMSRDYKVSPLPGITFERYRKFGFAVWDQRRLVDLGLWPSEKMLPANSEYYFRWRSILNEEESAQTGS
ncbi:putative F-box domain-containing protein [Seiridium unicorne]|uniref:F-box domain-containing protein n=1 Tax=Seiridium unicorne TaxID=138068 RepID=A0ABR2UZW8_9PEZI